MNQTLPRILALAPKGPEGIAVVAAACRASAFGIVDLALHPRVEAAEVFRQIARLTSGRFGVRVAAEETYSSSPGSRANSRDSRPSACGWVRLTFGSSRRPWARFGGRAGWCWSK